MIRYENRNMGHASAALGHGDMWRRITGHYSKENPIHLV